MGAPKNAPFVNRLAGNVASGGAAGATSLLVVYPLDFARTRLAVDVGSGSKREFNGLVDVIMKTARTAGWFKGGVYNGFAVSCVGIIFYRGPYFGIYDTVAPIIKTMGFMGKFLLAYAVTVVASSISYPLDTIRPQKHTSGYNAAHIRAAVPRYLHVSLARRNASDASLASTSLKRSAIGPRRGK